MPKCTVVGAGLAGLAAAEVLIGLGWTVDVVEARNRPGGRVCTEHGAFTNGQYAETGAEWIDKSHLRMRGLVERFGLDLDSTTGPWTSTRKFVNRLGITCAHEEVMATESGAQLDAFYQRISDYSLGVDPHDPMACADAKMLDSLSVADLMAQFSLNQASRLVITRHMQGEFACEPGDISVLFVAQQEALFTHMNGAGEDWSRRLIGGLSQIAHRLAEALVDHISYGESVLSVMHGHGGVRVATNIGRVINADAAIITAPLPALRAVAFDPELPKLVAEAIAELGMGTITKVFTQYDQKVWVTHGVDGYIYTDLPMQRTYEPTAMQPGTSGILTAYIGGDHGAEVAHLSAEERESDVAKQIDAIIPGALDHLTSSSSQPWPIDPFACGAYAVYGPGQVTKFWRALREPHGRLTFAGEHTATTTGYMEGALESGQRAALQTHELWA